MVKRDGVGEDVGKVLNSNFNLKNLLAKFQSSLPLAISLGLIVFLIISIWGGWQDLKEAFANFSWWTFILALILAFGNYLIRFGRWQYYLHLLGFQVDRLMSFRIFLSGLAFSITPGKFGELAKSWFLKEKADLPTSQTSPIVVAERLTDLLAIIVLALIGASQLQSSASRIILIIGLICLGAIGLVGVLGKARYFDKFSGKWQNLLVNLKQIILPGPLIIGVVLGIIAWGLEALALWIILIGLGQSVNFIAVIGIYTFATAIGAIAMLPGGLGLTEISLTGSMILVGVIKSSASAATILIRAATLWFAVLLGALVLLKLSKPDSKLMSAQRSIEN